MAKSDRNEVVSSEEKPVNYADVRLQQAIDIWRHDRPRWWLSHYGELLHGEDSEVAVHLRARFLELRDWSLYTLAKRRSRPSSQSIFSEHRLLLPGEW
ncbi:hypothetical protein [Aeromonas hydrophila]|uniref:hypothetical protein n=1 Tax=Aeromonas hydrophila TaxID=644 RepID=UPI003EC93A37